MVNPVVVFEEESPLLVAELSVQLAESPCGAGEVPGLLDPVAELEEESPLSVKLAESPCGTGETAGLLGPVDGPEEESPLLVLVALSLQLESCCDAWELADLADTGAEFEEESPEVATSVQFESGWAPPCQSEEPLPAGIGPDVESADGDGLELESVQSEPPC